MSTFVLPKVAKNCQKKPKVNFQLSYCTGSVDAGLHDNMGTVRLRCLWPVANSSSLFPVFYPIYFET